MITYPCLHCNRAKCKDIVCPVCEAISVLIGTMAENYKFSKFHIDNEIKHPPNGRVTWAYQYGEEEDAVLLIRTIDKFITESLQWISPYNLSLSDEAKQYLGKYLERAS